MTDQEQMEERLPTIQEFIEKIHLYKTYDIKESDFQDLWDLEYYDGVVDVFCIGCSKDTAFSRTKIVLPLDPNSFGKVYKSLNHAMHTEGNSWPLRTRYFDLVFKCPRDSEHLIIFNFAVQNSKVLKVGQYPSVRDLSEEETRKYRNVLGDDLYREFTSAIGLVSHGVGIGSFVYLRRIFESLIEKARSDAKADQSWNDAAYEKSRVDEKISLLRNHLPKFLVENKMLYGILSRGIHELSEEECLGCFEGVKTGIELILDQKLAEKEGKQKEKAGQQALQKISQYLKSKDKPESAERR